MDASQKHHRPPAVPFVQVKNHSYAMTKAFAWEGSKTARSRWHLMFLPPEALIWDSSPLSALSGGMWRDFHKHGYGPGNPSSWLFQLATSQFRGLEFR